MIHTNGLDSVKEMTYWSGIGDHLRARGISMLAIDHPGVGEALRLRDLPGRHDSEAWVTPAVDYLGSRQDVDPRRARIVELRYFGGLSIEETAAALGVSEETVNRDWRLARGWLLAQISVGR